MGPASNAERVCLISIYGLFDPRNGQLRYIGKTTNVSKRMEKHYGEARAGSRLHSRRWLDGLLALGLRADIVVLEEVAPEYANEAERFWIASMRLAGSDLTNQTIGGDGQQKGYKRSKEDVERCALALRGRRRTAKQRAAYRAAFNTPEEKQRRKELYARLKSEGKMTGRKFGQRLTEDHKRKIASSWTADRKAAHAAAQRAKPVDARWKAQLAAALRSRWDRRGAGS